MNISASPIRYTTYVNGTNAVKKLSSSPNSINFCGNCKVDEISPFLNKALSKLKKFSITEYKTLTEEEKTRLRDEYSALMEPKKAEAVEVFHDIFTERIRDKLDRHYGKGNYKVIIIGRSLSSISKVLGYKIGEENVINIPFSNGVQYLKEENLENIKKMGYIDIFREYLDTKGLNKNKIQNSEKKYIIMDYCISGKSLLGATRLMTRDDILGNRNIIKKDAVSLITNTTLRDYADKKLFNCEYKSLSFVRKAVDLDEIPHRTAFTEDADLKTKLTWFKLLDNQMTKEPNSDISMFISKLKDFFSI